MASTAAAGVWTEKYRPTKLADIKGHRRIKQLFERAIEKHFVGFPPTILTSGTRDLFLSNTVRTHRKLKRAGVTAELNVYEGISHAQFGFSPKADETREVFSEIGLFFDRYLGQN